jgi:hypothetical protein
MDKFSSTWRPNVMVPKQKEDTLSPVLPIFLYSMFSSFIITHFQHPKSSADQICLPNDPNVAKAGGLQSQGVKGEAVLGYREPLTTQNLKSSGFPEG